MKYETWLSEWMKNYVVPTAKPRTADHCEALIRLHILPRLGGMELSDLTAEVLQSLVAELLTSGNKKTGKGLAPNSVNAVVNVLQTSLKTAANVGEIPTSPTGRIRRPPAREKEIECFSVAEQKRIEEAVINGKKDKLFGILLCLYTGLRLGELLALEWSDIDFARGLLSVTKSCHDTKDGRVTDTPKTPSSRRVIPLPKQLMPLLRAHKKKSRSTFVVSSGGKPVSVRSYQRTFELLLRRLGIPHRGFHALRHTFATRALECGMDVKTLSEILGHKSPTVTLERYVHSLIEHKQAMMNRVGRLL